MASMDKREPAWIDAKKKYRLSNTTIQMAKELELNPENLVVLQTINSNLGKSRYRVLLELSIRSAFLQHPLKVTTISFKPTCMSVLIV